MVDVTGISNGPDSIKHSIWPEKWKKSLALIRRYDSCTSRCRALQAAFLVTSGPLGYSSSWLQFRANGCSSSWLQVHTWLQVLLGWEVRLGYRSSWFTGSSWLQVLLVAGPPIKLTGPLGMQFLLMLQVLLVNTYQSMVAGPLGCRSSWLQVLKWLQVLLVAGPSIWLQNGKSSWFAGPLRLQVLLVLASVLLVTGPLGYRSSWLQVLLVAGPLGCRFSWQ